MREKVVSDPRNVVLWLLCFEKKHRWVWNNRTYLNFVLVRLWSATATRRILQNTWIWSLTLWLATTASQNTNFLEENFGTLHYKISSQENECGFYYSYNYFLI